MTSKFVNLGTQNQRSLVQCNDKGVQASIKDEPAAPFCPSDESKRDDGWLQDVSTKKVGLGEPVLCDPMQTGQLENKGQRDVVYRYSKALRGCDEAMLEMFKTLVVIDEDGKHHPVPIIWASQEKAVAAILQDNVAKDNSLVVARPKLPMMAIYSNNLSFNQNRYTYHKAISYLRGAREDLKPGFTVKERYERDTIFGVARGLPVDVSYTLYAWTLYEEDMNQLVEQLLLKFSPISYIRVRGVPWETIVKLDSVANNLDVEPGDKSIRVIKYEFNFTVETYIPQPIVKKKAVLKTRVNIFDGLKTEDITGVIDRLEEAVEELQ